MTMAAERLFLDTNLLIAATDRARAEHSVVTRAFNETWPHQGVTLYTSGQVLREYLAVVTRPVDVNGLGLGASSALANVAAFRLRMTFLDENEKVAARLGGLIAKREVSGKRIHDANIVATMLAHGIQVLLTLNPRDFASFDGLVEVRGVAGH